MHLTPNYLGMKISRTNEHSTLFFTVTGWFLSSTSALGLTVQQSTVSQETEEKEAENAKGRMSAPKGGGGGARVSCTVTSTHNRYSGCKQFSDSIKCFLGGYL